MCCAIQYSNLDDLDSVCIRTCGVFALATYYGLVMDGLSVMAQQQRRLKLFGVVYN